MMNIHGIMGRILKLTVLLTPAKERIVVDEEKIFWSASNKYALDRHKLNLEKSMIPDAIKEIFETLSVRSTAYDIGANSGYWTLPMAKYFGIVHAWEPDSFVQKKLMKNILLNETLGLKIHVHTEVVTDVSGDILFYHLQLKDGEGLINNGLSGIYNRSLDLNGTNSIGITLDSLQNKIEGPAFIKIDVEGAESQVLRGAQKLISAYLPIIFWEASFNLVRITNGNNIRESMSLLDNFDYRHFVFLHNGIINEIGISFADSESEDCDVLSIPSHRFDIITLLQRYL
jgi:FkbM family methyltransferase